MLCQFRGPSKFINSIFISGISETYISKLISGPIINSNKENNLIYPEILFRFPQNDSGITPSILEYIFAEGISIEFNQQPPKFIPVVLTNEKGGRSYVYSIRLFDKIEINHKNYFLPYTISIWSSINNCEGFKNILTEFYRIIKMTGNNIIDNSIINYHNLEIIHMIIFLTDIILPPNNSKMILNFHYSSVEIYFQSLNEIPNNEEYIKLLFDCLEISTIIKLWCSLLSEKHTIFLANQGYLLFAVTQGLLSLMFPFCWLHTYIPVLPVNQIDYLDSPTPYIIGIISNKIDYITLNERFPGHVICDLNTSTINKNGVSFLSNVEEDKIKKKIRFLYNPKMYEVEDIYLDESDKKKYNNKNFELEDIDLKKSFGENIHYIFFRIFRYQLSVIQKNFVKNKVFDIQIFLEDYCQDEMMDFWDKLTSTVAFDNFLMSLSGVEDDPSSKIFLNILSLEEIENNELNLNDKSPSNEIKDKIESHDKNKEILTITYNLPLNINYLLNQFIEMDETNDDYGKALINLKKDYNSCIQVIKHNKSLKVLFQKKKSKERKSFMIPLKRNNNSIDTNSFFSFNPKNFQNSTSHEINSKMIRIPSTTTLSTIHDNDQIEVKLLSSKDLNNKSKNKNKIEKKGTERKGGRKPSIIIYHHPFKSLFYLYGLDTIKSIEQKIIKNQIRKLTNNSNIKNDIIFFDMDEDNNDLVYHQDFLSFSKFFFVTLTLKKNVTMGYKNVFIKKIKVILTKNFEEIGEKSEENSSVEAMSDKEDSKNNNSQSNILKMSDSEDSITSNNFELKNKSSISCLKSGGENNEKQSIDKKSSSPDIKDKTSNVESDSIINKKTSNDKNNVSMYEEVFESENKLKIKSFSAEYLEYLDIMDINSNLLSQFFLFSAYILELDNIDGFNRDIFTILKLYERGFLENEKEFPYNSFYNFLNNADYILLHSYYQRIIDSKEYDDKLKNYLKIIAQKLKIIDSKEKGIRNKLRTFKSMKMDCVPIDFKNSLSERQYSRKQKNSSNKSLQFKNSLLFDEKYFLNNSLYNYMRRKNTEQEKNPLKMNILNLYKKYKKTTKDPLQLVEEIAVHIYLFILKKSLHKIQPEIITPKLLFNLSNSSDFQPIKDLVAELQVIDLKYLLKISDEHKYAFWLNIFNFLMVFAVIYRKELLLTYYEWHKLKMNSYFNIGGINFSLYEIETNILRNNYMAKKLFSEIIDFPKGDSRNKFKIENNIKYINFAISEPMTSSFKLQLYFPQTIQKQILKNAIDYFNSRILVDGKNILVKIPEYLSWVDDNFLGNLNYYKPVINNDVYDFIKKNQDKVEFIKHDWSLNFSDSIV